MWCNDYDPANEPLLITNLEGGTSRGNHHADGEEHHLDDDAATTRSRVQLSGLRGAVTEGTRVTKPDQQAGGTRREEGEQEESAEEGEHEEQEEEVQRWRVSQYEVCVHYLRRRKRAFYLPPHHSMPQSKALRLHVAFRASPSS